MAVPPFIIARYRHVRIRAANEAIGSVVQERWSLNHMMRMDVGNDGCLYLSSWDVVYLAAKNYLDPSNLQESHSRNDS